VLHSVHGQFLHFGSVMQFRKASMIRSCSVILASPSFPRRLLPLLICRAGCPKPRTTIL
jgi:hypothetical protein